MWDNHVTKYLRHTVRVILQQIEKRNNTTQSLGLLKYTLMYSGGPFEAILCIFTISAQCFISVYYNIFL